MIELTRSNEETRIRVNQSLMANKQSRNAETEADSALQGYKLNF